MSYKMENRERKEIQLMRFIWVVRIKKKKKRLVQILHGGFLNSELW